jgi:tape measure domain-containing protein
MATVTVEVLAKDSFSGVLGNFGSIMTGVESAINLAGQAFGFLKDQAMAGLDAVASYERLELSLQSLIASQMVQAGVATDVASAMEVAGIQAEELVKWNEELAIKSPFTSEGVAQAFRMSMAYGFTTDEAQRLTEAMIDFASGSGASEYAMQQIARALGQISATGKLTGGDMLQLVNAGLPVAEILAEAFGVTTAQIMDMREKGLIPAQDAIEAITVWMEENFAGAAERQASSWAGLKGTFSDLQQMGLREFFGGLFEALQPLANTLAAFLQSEGLGMLGTIGDKIGSLLEPLRAFFAEVNKWHELEPDLSILHAMGITLRNMGDAGTILYSLGVGFMNFAQQIEAGLTPLQALEVVSFQLSEGNGPLARLGEVIFNAITLLRTEGWKEGLTSLTMGLLDLLEVKFEGTPLAGLIDGLQGFLLDVQDEGLGVAIKNLFDNTIKPAVTGAFESLWTGSGWQEKIQGLVNNLTIAINETDWTSVGNTIAGVLSGVLKTVLGGLYILVEQVDWSPLGKALGVAAGEIWQGLFSNENAQKLEGSLSQFFTGFFRIEEIKAAWAPIGASIVEGIKAGISGNLLMFYVNMAIFAQNVINYFKALLGIASPSTVFMEIGRNIVLGLMSGILSMFPSLTSVVSAMFDLLTGGNSGRTGGATGDATGLLGGGSGTIGGSGTSGVLMGGTVTNIYNFYGTTFVNGAGPAGTYDCAPTISSGGMIPAGVR